MSCCWAAYRSPDLTSYLAARRLSRAPSPGCGSREYRALARRHRRDRGGPPRHRRSRSSWCRPVGLSTARMATAPPPCRAPGGVGDQVLVALAAAFVHCTSGVRHRVRGHRARGQALAVARQPGQRRGRRRGGPLPRLLRLRGRCTCSAAPHASSLRLASPHSRRTASAAPKPSALPAQRAGPGCLPLWVTAGIGLRRSRRPAPARSPPRPGRPRDGASRPPASPAPSWTAGRAPHPG